MTSEDFASLLPVWREAANVERADIDKALSGAGIKVPERFTSQLENRRLRSPDRDVCEVIARLVKLDPAYVWRVSALERIRKADALDFFEEATAGTENECLRAENERLRAHIAAIRAAVLEKP